MENIEYMVNIVDMQKAEVIETCAKQLYQMTRIPRPIETVKKEYETFQKACDELLVGVIDEDSLILGTAYQPPEGANKAIFLENQKRMLEGCINRLSTMTKEEKDEIPALVKGLYSYGYILYKAAIENSEE